MALASAPSIVRIRPARWFAHADDLGALAALVRSRSAALDAARDHRAPFAHAYSAYLALATDAVECGRLGAATSWMTKLLLEHAHAWLRALDGYDRREVALVPGAWRGVFARQRNGLTASEGVRISLAAHLLYDLPLALARTDVSSLDAGALSLAEREHRRIVLATFAPGALPLALRPAARRIAREHAQGWADGTALANARFETERTLIFERVRLTSLRAIAP